ncbi:hypothetical protein TNCV_2665061, partial [Trichonephila clavipes]
PLDKLAIIADKVFTKLLVHPHTICAATTVLHHPGHLHCAVFSQPWTLSPGRSRAVSTGVAERQKPNSSPPTI